MHLSRRLHCCFAGFCCTAADKNQHRLDEADAHFKEILNHLMLIIGVFTAALLNFSTSHKSSEHASQCCLPLDFAAAADKNQHRLEEADAHFKEIQNAYEVLSDKHERAW
jgi:hypothetical protein